MNIIAKNVATLSNSSPRLRRKNERNAKHQLRARSAEAARLNKCSAASRSYQVQRCVIIPAVIRAVVAVVIVAEGRMITVHIFGLPIGACDPNKTWKAAADHIGRRLQSRFGENVLILYIELYSPESFKYENIVNLLKEGQTPPFVTINGKLIQAGGKLSERNIAQELERLLATHIK